MKVPETTLWPDFLVVRRKVAGVIEVDGGSHLRRLAADQSRDRLLKRAGIASGQGCDGADEQAEAIKPTATANTAERNDD